MASLKDKPAKDEPATGARFDRGQRHASLKITDACDGEAETITLETRGVTVHGKTAVVAPRIAADDLATRRVSFRADALGDGPICFGVVDVRRINVAKGLTSEAPAGRRSGAGCALNPQAALYADPQTAAQLGAPAPPRNTSPHGND